MYFSIKFTIYMHYCLHYGMQGMQILLALTA